MEEYDIDMDFDIGMEVQERHYIERINFDTEGLAHKEKFRLTQEMVDYIEYRIGEDLRHATSRSHALSPRQQIHLCLRFLSGNAFYHINGDAHGVHKSSVCRAIHSVVAAINETLLSEFVHFPTNAAGVQQQVFCNEWNAQCLWSNGRHIDKNTSSKGKRTSICRSTWESLH